MKCIEVNSQKRKRAQKDVECLQELQQTSAYPKPVDLLITIREVKEISINIYELDASRSDGVLGC